jgi:hypothetical protein
LAGGKQREQVTVAVKDLNLSEMHLQQPQCIGCRSTLSLLGSMFDAAMCLPALRAALLM